MMGLPLPDLDVPVVKATNCILATSTDAVPAAAAAPCRASAAPAAPRPARPNCSRRNCSGSPRRANFGKAQEYNLFDCIECGCCSYVCPSHIPLVHYYRFAKSEIWAHEKDKTRRRPGARAPRIPPVPRRSAKRRKKPPSSPPRRSRRQASWPNAARRQPAAKEPRRCGQRRRRQEGADRRRAGARAGEKGRGRAEKHRQPAARQQARDRGDRGAPG